MAASIEQYGFFTALVDDVHVIEYLNYNAER